MCGSACLTNLLVLFRTQRTCPYFSTATVRATEVLNAILMEWNFAIESYPNSIHHLLSIPMEFRSVSSSLISGTSWLWNMMPLIWLKQEWQLLLPISKWSTFQWTIPSSRKMLNFQWPLFVRTLLANSLHLSYSESPLTTLKSSFKCKRCTSMESVPVIGLSILLTLIFSTRKCLISSC